MIEKNILKIQKDYLAKMKLITDNIRFLNLDSSTISELDGACFSIFQLQISLLYPIAKSYEKATGVPASDVLRKAFNDFISKMEDHFQGDNVKITYKEGQADGK